MTPMPQSSPNLDNTALQEEMAAPDPIAVQADAASLQALLQLLHALSMGYQAQHQTLLRKQSALVSGSPMANKAMTLQSIDRELLSQNKRITQLNTERQQILTVMGCQDWTLTQLIQHLLAGDRHRQHMAQQLSTASVTLETAVREAQRLNQDIRGLLELSIRWAKDTVEIITSAFQPEASSYTAHGNKTSGTMTPEAPTRLHSTINHSV